jgi:hypothetical protein
VTLCCMQVIHLREDASTGCYRVSATDHRDPELQWIKVSMSPQPSTSNRDQDSEPLNLKPTGCSDPKLQWRSVYVHCARLFFCSVIFAAIFVTGFVAQQVQLRALDDHYIKSYLHVIRGLKLRGRITKANCWVAAISPLPHLSSPPSS